MKQLLSLFNLRPVEIKLYETLFYSGTMSASHLAKEAEISRTSVYDLIERLIETGLVTETTKAGIKMFAVLPPKKIELLLHEKQTNISSATNALKHLEQAYASQLKIRPPRLQLFEGRKELQQMMKDMLLYRDTTVRVYWPVKHIVALLTPAFLERFHRERVERNIDIKVIWPKRQAPSAKLIPFLKIHPNLKREVRIAPPRVNFSLGYALYGHTVRFISSSKESFGFLVESQELAEMMTSQWQMIWDLSKPYK